MNIEWRTVTWYSKIAAVIVFVGTFFLGFGLGRMKTEIVYVEVPHVTAYHKGRRNEHYVLGGDMLTWFDFLTLVAKVTGAKPPRWVAPSWLLMIAGYIELSRHYLFGHRPEITPELVRLLSTGESVQYPEKFKTQTELEYESSAEAAIRKCHAWMQAERAARDSAAAKQPAS